MNKFSQFKDISSSGPKYILLPERYVTRFGAW